MATKEYAMFESNVNKVEKKAAISNKDLLLAMLGGKCEVTTKVMRGSKASGDCILTVEQAGVEIFKINAGKLSEWDSVDDLNLSMFQLVSSIHDEMGAYLAQYQAKINDIECAKREKAERTVEGVRLELTNAKSPSEIRKVLKNSGFHNARLEAAPNKVDLLCELAEMEFAAFIENSVKV